MDSPTVAATKTTSWPRLRSIRLVIAAIGVVLAWASVAVAEFISFSNTSVLVFLIPPFELALWMAAGTLTVLLLGLAGVRWLVRSVVVVLLALVSVHFINWAAFHPVSYYATHEYAFAAMAAAIRNGSIHLSNEYYGEPLPYYLRDLSTNGKVAIVGYQDGVPVLFLPQWIGIPDDAAGYVFFDGDARPDLAVDLFGAPANVSAGIDLGDSWWYLRPGDLNSF